MLSNPLKPVIKHLSTIIVVVLACRSLANAEDTSTDTVDYPRVTFDLRGPAGQVESLVFAESPTRLYVAGEDKVVEVYFVGKDRRERPMATRATTLRWERGRYQLGKIRALAVSEKARSVAVGGWSLRAEVGDIALFGTRIGRAVGALPSENRDQTGQVAKNAVRVNGHIAQIQSLAYSPSGANLVSIDSYGEVRLWDTSRQLVESIAESTIIQSANRAEKGGVWFFGAKAILPNDGTLILAEPVDRAVKGSSWGIFLYQQDATGKFRRSPKPLASGRGMVSCLVRNATGNVLAAGFEPVGTTSASVHVFRMDGKSATLSGLDDLSNLRLACGPEDLLVVSGTTKQGLQVLRFFNCRTFRLVASQTERPELGPAQAIAFNATGEYLARDSVAEKSVVLYRVQPRPSDQGSFVVSEPRKIKSSALLYRSVRFSADNRYVIALNTEGQTTDDPKKARSYFDLKGMKRRVLMRRAKWVSRDGCDEGWKVEPMTEPRGREYRITDPSGHRWILSLNSQQGKMLVHYRFRPKSTDTDLLAIATESSGVYVYRLAKSDRSPVLMRYFRGHTGVICGISASPDGRLLATASSDRMVNIWNLEGTASAGNEVAACRLGAEFQDRGQNGLEVKHLEPNGILAARGFTGQTRITKLYYRPDPGNPKDGRMATVGQEMLKAIETSPSEMMLVFELSNNEREMIWMTPGWEPLVTLYMTETDDWACATGSGYYAASDGDGHELLVWQQNRGRTKPVRLVRGTELRSVFHRHDVLQGLIEGGSLLESLAEHDVSAKSAAIKTGHLLTSAFDNASHVQLIEPGVDRVFAERDNVRIVANIQLPKGESSKNYVTQAIVNGQPIGSPTLESGNSENAFLAKWESSPVSPVNRVRVLLKRRAATSEESIRFAESTYASNAPPKQLRIHSLAVGANTYTGDLAPLTYAVNDASGVAAMIESFNAPSLTSGTHLRLLNNEVSRDAISSAMNDLKDVITKHTGEQLLIVFLAGHGKQQGDEYYFLTPDVTSAEEITTHGVSWREFESLASLPCRKLFIIDTCDSGAAAGLAESGRAVQGLSESQMVVIAATAPNQAAREIFTFNNGTLSHCLLTGLKGENGRVGRADGAGESGSVDGVVTLRELADYIRTELPALSLEHLDEEQHPTIAPSDLLSIQSIPLMQTAQ